MRRIRAVAVAMAIASPAVVIPMSQRATSPAAPAFDLRVDSIMRGPGLVGHSPADLRWSADSERLYFHWQRPGEKEPSTYMVGRGGGDPRRLSDAEVKEAPPAGGRWDIARRRVVAVEDGDVFIHDGTTGRRVQVTRTATTESGARWARNDTHVTYVRDGNRFIVPVDAASAATVAQVTDVVPRSAEPRLSDSQIFIRDEEERLIEYIREQKEQKRRAEENVCELT